MMWYVSDVAIPVVVDLLLRLKVKEFNKIRKEVAIPVVVDLLLRQRQRILMRCRPPSQSLL